MVKYKLESKQYKNIVNIIKDEASEKMDGIKNTFYEKRILAPGKVINIYIIEKYLLRISSNLSITVILEENEEGSFIEIISSGGGVGLTTRTFGAEAASVKNIIKELKELGYTLVE